MRKFIFGTDWGEDCDDCVALRILAMYHRAGKISLEGVCVNTYDENSTASVYGFLNKEGICVPVGVDKSTKHIKIETRYQARLAQYAPDKTNDDAEHSPRLYRKILASAKGKVDIIEVGFLNSLCDALLSEGDDISPKTGMELFKEKVEKIWIMGGKWNEQGGKEYNLARHKEARESASIVLEKCPCPMTFLGWEIGANLITGDTLDKGDYLWQALNDHGSGDGRESWDPMLTLMAIIGDEEKAGYTTVSIDARVDAQTGANYFELNENSNRKFVIKAHPDSYYSEMINEIITKKEL